MKLFYLFIYLDLKLIISIIYYFDTARRGSNQSERRVLWAEPENTHEEHRSQTCRETPRADRRSLCPSPGRG